MTELKDKIEFPYLVGKTLVERSRITIPWMHKLHMGLKEGDMLQVTVKVTSRAEDAP